MPDHDHPTVTGWNLPLDHPDLLELLRFFHGHVGPYAVLGYRIGQRAMSVLGAEKYFGMQVTVTGPKTTPYTCLIDGLQVSTGCTTGKGNIAVAADDPPPGLLFAIQFGFGNRRLSVRRVAAGGTQRGRAVCQDTGSSGRGAVGGAAQRCPRRLVGVMTGEGTTPSTCQEACGRRDPGIGQGAPSSGAILA